MEAIRAAIEHYLRANPLAADTAKGIATCWLPHSGIGPAYQPLVDALQVMVASRHLLAVELPDGEILYRCGPALRVD